MSAPLRVAILGSTGSIGRQALDVAAAHPDRIEIVSLAANTSSDEVVAQARRFGVSRIAMQDEDAARRVAEALGLSSVASGSRAVAQLAADDDVDIVLNALVGFAGLRVTVAALESGKTLALANKESLVVGGELVMELARNATMLPVDSEHSAIFQCYAGEDSRDVTRILLTASGGPFRGRTRESLRAVTAADALAHPTWAMGPKITVDSATLMNKGLEVIEAHHLFGVGYDDIKVVVHPQSCVHSMLEFADGSVKAHLGATDMRIPIQYAFSYPRRWSGPREPVDFASLAHLDFEEPDTTTFGCLALAFAAGRAGGTAPAVLNAANEVAVAAFLSGRCGLLDIESTVESTMEAFETESVQSIDHLVEVDARARDVARALLDRVVGGVCS